MRFDPDRFYTTDAPELEQIAPKTTLQYWRHKRIGPRFARFGRRVIYRGADLNEWIESQIVNTSQNGDIGE